MSGPCETCAHTFGDARSTVLRLIAQRAELISHLRAIVSSSSTRQDIDPSMGVTHHLHINGEWLKIMRDLIDEIEGEK